MHHYRYVDGHIDEHTDEFHIKLTNKVSRDVLTVTLNVADLTAGLGIEVGGNRSAHLDLLGRAIASALNQATEGPEDGDAPTEVQA
jgi:hypothetical protein